MVRFVGSSLFFEFNSFGTGEVLFIFRHSPSKQNIPYLNFAVAIKRFTQAVVKTVCSMKQEVHELVKSSMLLFRSLFR